MAPQRGALSDSTGSGNSTTAYSLSLLTEYTHTLDSLPLDLSRNFADLRELDAVLSSSMSSITSKIHTLTRMIEQGTAPKEERLWLLTEIAEEAARLKLGGEDKIRVACQAADNLKSHMGYLRTLTEHLPGFDPSVLNRKTTYPHVAARSFMSTSSMESGRRRRGGFGSLLVAAPDPSPAKRKRVVRDEELDTSHLRSPKKDRGGDSRQRNGGRAKRYVILSWWRRCAYSTTARNERAVSPSESLVSVTSHVPLPSHNGGGGVSRVVTNNSSRGGNSSAAVNKRSRSSANNTNNRNPTPQLNDQYPPHDHPSINHNGTHTHSNTSSRRETFNVPPSSSSHPSLPMPYQAPSNGAVGHHPYGPPPSLSNTPEWAPPNATQLEGPGMPVARSQSAIPVAPGFVLGVSTGTDGGATEAGDGEGDGDDKTYCFCDGVSYGEMIACDDEQCEKEWVSCVSNFVADVSGLCVLSLYVDFTVLVCSPYDIGRSHPFILVPSSISRV